MRTHKERKQEMSLSKEEKKGRKEQEIAQGT